MLLKDDLIKHSDVRYGLGKYEIRQERSEFDGALVWVIYYKNLGVESEATTLDEAVDWIIQTENYDGGEPE